MNIWYYTTADRWSIILDDEYLVLPQRFADDGEGPITWLTTKDDWDPYMNMMRRDSATGSIYRLRDMLLLGIIPIRFKISPLDLDLYPWSVFKKMGYTKEENGEYVEELHENRFGCDVNSWLISLNPIPASSIIGIEIWDGEVWREIKL